MGPRIALVAALVALPAGTAAAQTTLDRQIVPVTPRADAFTFLTYGPGQPYVVREDLAAAEKRRRARRRSLAYFAQLSDFQLADEESPLRVEFSDRLDKELASAWRPQEALQPHTIDASIRSVNSHVRSPVRHAGGRRARLGFAVLTGDNADNQQRNETRWVAQLIEGGVVHPNSGVDDGACPGVPAGEGARYTGVQDLDDYPEAGHYWDPDRPMGQWAGWPSWPGLMDRAQLPFEAAGLDVPSYVAVGNHDALVQGNEDAIALWEQVARGCVKPIQGTPTSQGLSSVFTGDLLRTSPSGTIQVPRDPERTLVTMPEYRALFEGRQADAHGFGFIDAEELIASRGDASYYDFSPARGLRFIGLDTVADSGVTGISHDGNVDDPQFRWLMRTIERAERADELVVLFSHHAPVDLTARAPDEVVQPCVSPAAPQDDPNPGCDLDPRSSSPLHLGADMVEALLEHPHVVAWVAGHSHVNDVRAHRGPRGGFWVIRTSSEADFPHQDRLVELMDNRDGTLSIFGTLLDNAGPAAAPTPGTPAAAMSLDDLASVARTLGYNEPDFDPLAPGETADRNVELLVADPRRGRSDRRPGVTIRVRPAQVRRGRLVRFRIAVRRGRRPVRGAVVRVKGRRLVTGRRGRVAVRLRFRRIGTHRVRALGRTAPILVTRRG